MEIVIPATMDILCPMVNVLLILIPALSQIATSSVQFGRERLAFNALTELSLTLMESAQ